VSAMPDYPIRQKSAQGKPAEPLDVARTCEVCKASFRYLAPWKTGERGLWRTGRMAWCCSRECYDEAPS
jgi:hypothetical protein